jgi:anti-sigma factor ChrR (cupin superfamily)
MTDTLSLDELNVLDEIVAGSIAPVDPPAALRARILAAVGDTPQNSTTVRANEGRWLRLVPGVTVKPLMIDESRGTATILMTLQPGARVGGHDHHGPEDSFVISGSCHIGPTYLSKGDFHHAEAGTHHGEIVSDDGCVLLLVVDRADYLAA